MENHHFLWENQLEITIFNSYVSLPEGNEKIMMATNYIKLYQLIMGIISLMRK